MENKVIRVPGGIVKASKYFTKLELRCRCKRDNCDALPMKQEFLDKLDKLREEFGKPLKPTSAARCKYWNTIQGGSSQSQHLLSNACDFWIDEKEDLNKLIELAEKVGLGGIGHGRFLLHVDDRGHRARWTYPND